MNLLPTAQATLLLTSYFSKASSEDVKPLTTKEWAKFAFWLKEKSVSPADLLGSDPVLLLGGWHDTRVSVDRITRLLNRGHSLALAVEKWQRAGLWVVTRSDPEYPKRLKHRLEIDSPPVLFGCGNKTLLNAGGLAVVGSRNVGDADLSFAEQAGSKAAAEGFAIVSGGARGVDEAAMLGAMHGGGPVIGVISDSLLKAATSARWRKGLLGATMALVSPFYPEAGFSAGNAMARNKYIYCLADSSLVIHAGKKGGTLNGAEENLKKLWVPLWVKPTPDNGAANADLVAKGGRWCESNIQALKVSDFFFHTPTATQQVREGKVDLFSMPAQPETSSESASEPYMGIKKTQEVIDSSAGQGETRAPIGQTSGADEPITQVDFYQLFITELRRLSVSPVTPDALAQNTGLHKSQLEEWLKRATDERLVKKLNRPVRYQVKREK